MRLTRAILLLLVPSLGLNLLPVLPVVLGAVKRTLHEGTVSALKSKAHGRIEGLVELRARFANPLAARLLPTEGIARAQHGMNTSSCNRSRVNRVATRIGQPALGAPAHVLPARAVRTAHVLPDTHGRLSPFLSTLASHHNCCTRIALLGGSTACGGHSGDGKLGGILTGSCGFPAGMNGTWAASLVRYLNARTTDCCRRGHDFRNLCAAGRGTEYMLEVFDSLTQRGLAEAQLIFVDTAANDYNSWFVQEFRPSLSAQHLERKRRHAVMVDTEQLLRLLRHRAPLAAVMYVETACVCRRVEPRASRPPTRAACTQPATCSAPRAADFYAKQSKHARPEEPAFDAERVLGAWPLHEPVLRHYGVPTVLVGAALQEETRRLGLPTEGYGAPLTDTLAHPLSRHWLLQDKVHLSAEGHQLTALLVAAALQACSLIVLWEVYENACIAPLTPRALAVLERCAAAVAQPHCVRPACGAQMEHSLRRAPTFNTLPAPLFSTTSSVNGPSLTRLDFTDPSGAWEAHVSEDSWVGWEWLVARKQPAGYSFSPMVRGAAVAGSDKLGLIAVGPGAYASARVSLRRGTVRFGYLRSPDAAMGAVEVSLRGAPRRQGGGGALCLLNGTWELAVSIYTSTECSWDLSWGADLAHSLTGGGETRKQARRSTQGRKPATAIATFDHDPNATSLRILEFRLLPSATASLRRFTLYTVSAW